MFLFAIHFKNQPNRSGREIGELMEEIIYFLCNKCGFKKPCVGARVIISVSDKIDPGTGEQEISPLCPDCRAPLDIIDEDGVKLEP